MTTDSDLREAIDRNELRTEWGAWAIIVGLVAEVLLAYFYPHGKNFIETWGPVIATALIAAGVYAEIYFGRRTSENQKELQIRTDLRLAGAIERAAKADENLADFLMSRRSVIGPNKGAIATQLSLFQGTMFDVGFGMGDIEQADFAWDLEEILKDAGWNQVDWQPQVPSANVIGGRSNHPVAGNISSQNLEVHLDPFSEQHLRPAAEALITVLADYRVKATIVALNVASPNRQAMHLLVGPKR